jgi:hypothetical protein
MINLLVNIKFSCLFEASDGSKVTAFNTNSSAWFIYYYGKRLISSNIQK